jgi:uncharacterized protein
MTPLVIYHDHCTDGFASAYSAWLALGEEAEYLPYSYGQDLDPSKTLYEDRLVYILDFSFPIEILKRLLSAAKKVVWLDHHKSAFESLGMEYYRGIISKVSDDRKEFILDDTMSGAMISWMYFHPGVEPPLYIKEIDDRDRWQFKLPGSKATHAWLQAQQPWSFEQWKSLDWSSIREYGELLLKVKSADVNRSSKKARIVRVKNPRSGKLYKGLAVNCQSHMSEVGHELANNSGTYGFVWYLDVDNRVKVSLRSNDEYDVSMMAKMFGGGGHKNAAGCEMSLEQLMEFLV